jgi:hypothetical protein
LSTPPQPSLSDGGGGGLARSYQLAMPQHSTILLRGKMHASTQFGVQRNAKGFLHQDRNLGIKGGQDMHFDHSVFKRQRWRTMHVSQNIGYIRI